MKYLATAKVVSIAAVTAKLLTYGSAYKDGMIFVEIPELGFVGANQILCRYGLSVPYIKIEADQKLWVEPTIDTYGNQDRWIYTGFADSVASATSSTNVFSIYFSANQYINFKSTGEIEIKAGIDALEKLLLGETTQAELDKLKTDLENLVTTFNSHTHATAALGAPSPPNAPASAVTADFDNVLSAKVEAN